MPLLNQDVDHVLSTKEVKEMLLEDCWEFDSNIKQIKKRWNIFLLGATWAKKKPIPDDRVVVTAWKEEGTIFRFKPENRPCAFSANLPMCWLAEKPKITGLCIGDLESLVCEMETTNTVRVLLEAGFVLRLVVYKFDVVL